MDAWRQYENGKSHKRSIGLYRRVDENEKFFRGDQKRWTKSYEGMPTAKAMANWVNKIVMELDDWENMTDNFEVPERDD